MKNQINTNSNKFDKAVEWSKENPVKAGLIGLSSIVLLRAVGIKRAAKFAATTGIGKLFKSTVMPG